MAKLWLIAAAWIVLALLAPELRPLLLVSSFCWFGGFVVGTQHRAKSDQELAAARLVRQLEA